MGAFWTLFVTLIGYEYLLLDTRRVSYLDFPRFTSKTACCGLSMTEARGHSAPNQ